MQIFNEHLVYRIIEHTKKRLIMPYKVNIFGP